MSVVLYKILCFISPSHRCDSVKAVKGKQPLSWSQTQSYSSKQLEYVFTFLLLLLLFLVVSAVVLLVCTFKCLFVYCKLFCRKIVLNFVWAYVALFLSWLDSDCLCWCLTFHNVFKSCSQSTDVFWLFSTWFNDNICRYYAYASWMIIYDFVRTDIINPMEYK